MHFPKIVAYAVCLVVAVTAAVPKQVGAQQITSPPAQAPTSANLGARYLFGTLQSDPDRAATVHAAGVTLALVSVAWRRYEPREGVWDEAYLKSIKSRIQSLRTQGQQIVLDPGCQYPPDWVLQLPHARFVNQYGDSYEDEEPGKNVPNVVFNAKVRQKQEIYIASLLQEVGNDFHHIRLGGGWYGELHYPPASYKGRTNCYWAFDPMAQGKVPGLPTGIGPCPIPGWKPGESSENHRSASLFANWYLEAMRNYQDWQISALRRSYSGSLVMMYPGWGMRPGQLEDAVAGDLDGGTSTEKNGEFQAGDDFARFVASIRDPKIIVYTTWIDAPFGNDKSREPREWTPGHYLSFLAAANPIGLPVMGENTGRNDSKALERSVERMRNYGLLGLMWAFEPELFDGKHATLAQYKVFIGKAQRGEPSNRLTEEVPQNAQ